jgi:general secretion pathway protein I
MPVRTARGFTLIEVLMALTVLAIALAAILRTIGQSIDLTVDLRDRQLAAWVAQNRLITHQLQRDWPSATATDGTTEQVSTTPEPALRRIEIEIRATTGEQRLARLIGFLEEPQQ